MHDSPNNLDSAEAHLSLLLLFHDKWNQYVSFKRGRDFTTKVWLQSWNLKDRCRCVDVEKNPSEVAGTYDVNL